MAVNIDIDVAVDDSGRVSAARPIRLANPLAARSFHGQIRRWLGDIILDMPSR
jgi:hypothetical protein